MEEKKPFFKSRTIQVLGVLVIIAASHFYLSLNLPTLSPEDLKAVEAVKGDVIRLTDAVRTQRWFDVITIAVSIAAMWFRYTATAKLK